MTEESVEEIRARLAKEQAEFDQRAQRVLDQIKSNRSIQTKQHLEQAITRKLERISQFDLVELTEERVMGNYSAKDTYEQLTKPPRAFEQGKVTKTPLEQILAYEESRFEER